MRPLRATRNSIYPLLSHQRRSLSLSARRREQTVVLGQHDVVDEPPPDSAPPPTTKAKAKLFVDSAFPVRLSLFDFRPYLAKFVEEDVVSRISDFMKSVHVHGFNLIKIERPRDKDGGILVHFSYDAPPTKEQQTAALEDLEQDLQAQAAKAGGLPTWVRWHRAQVWLVKGQPWYEDMHRYPSSIVKVEFEGPDVHEEVLYERFRKYGRIEDISRPVPVPAGAHRFSNVSYRRIRSAVKAQNCLHGLMLSGQGASTRLSISYERRLKAHLVRDWISSHPRIVLPIIAFLLGTLTYTIFDPVRAFFVQAKVQDWFSYKDNSILKWLRRNTLDRLSLDFSSGNPVRHARGGWEERKEAEQSILHYLSDVPDGITFLHGPPGSGKNTLINRIIEDTHRPSLIIDCTPVVNASSESAILLQLANQTGYWPVFSFLNSLNNLFDLASQGLIGQKAGFSKTLDSQLDEMLEVVASALHSVNSSHIKKMHALDESDKKLAARREEEALRRWKIKRGIWHDPRLDCVAGNGLMSEVGIGDENLWDDDAALGKPEISPSASGSEESALQSKVALGSDLSGMPIVVLRNFDTKDANKRVEVLDALAKWADALVDNHAAHVVVVSDNRESAKRIDRAMGPRPLVTVTLNDADVRSAQHYVTSRLEDQETSRELTSSEQDLIARLGGRSTDLETLVNKVRNGLTVPEAVEDIIQHTLGELRKNAFGDDMEDAKSLAWKREQAWTVVKLLAKQSEVSYAATILDFPFKGDDSPLREMERADLISIATNDGFPVAIRPGRPIYRYVFERLVNDPVFASLLEITTNERLIASAESTVKACEDELTVLRNIGMDRSSILSAPSATAERADALLRKMRDAQRKIVALEQANSKFKKQLPSRPNEKSFELKGRKS